MVIRGGAKAEDPGSLNGMVGMEWRGLREEGALRDLALPLAS